LDLFLPRWPHIARGNIHVTIECKGPAQVFGRIEGELRASESDVSARRSGAAMAGLLVFINDVMKSRRFN
jgi:hypothetical protein